MIDRRGTDDYFSISELRASKNELDDIPGRIIKSPEQFFTGLKQRKPIYDILCL
ncbi:MAG: hypothetical protein ACTSQY_10205 [Candidatus Odinarchaeia archaeon]